MEKTYNIRINKEKFSVPYKYSHCVNNFVSILKLIKEKDCNLGRKENHLLQCGPVCLKCGTNFNNLI